MKVKIIGIKHSSGEYKGYPFDNYVLTCVREATTENSVGLECIDVKKTTIKSKFLASVTGLTGAEIFAKVGFHADLLFNEYGRVDRVLFEDSQ